MKVVISSGMEGVDNSPNIALLRLLPLLKLVVRRTSDFQYS